MTPIPTGSKRRYIIWGDDNHYNTLHTYLSRTHLHMTLCFYFELEMRTVFPTHSTYCLDPAFWIGEDKIYAGKSPNVRLYSTFSSWKKKNEPNPLTYILLFEFLESKK